MKSETLLAFALAAAAPALARDVPANLKAFRSRVSVGACSASNTLQGGFHSQQHGPKDFAYCKYSANATAREPTAIYLKGARTGVFANMDVDCDGDPSRAGADGRCASSTDTQGRTSFKHLVQHYSAAAGAVAGGKVVVDLNANFHPYVVFGNEGHYSPTFDPKRYNVQPLSVMAVVCGEKLFYALWGDTNGDDGPPMVGEASIALATACFGTGVNGNSGHDQDDVLYVAFPGSVAETVPRNARWNAKSFVDFEASIAQMGDALVQRLA